MRIMGSNKFNSCKFSVLFVVLSYASCVAAQNLEYGSICNNNDNTNGTCSPVKHLICDDVGEMQRCVCKATLFYEDSQSTCVAKADGTSTCWNSPLAGNFPTRCTSQAECIQSNNTLPGFCECYEGYLHQSATGLCKATYGTECQAGSCDRYSFLQCGIDSKCGCDQKLAIWNGKMCESIVNGKCDNSLNRPRVCIVNAQCNKNSSLCECQNNFIPTTDGLCFRSFDQDCTPGGNDCHPDLICHNTTKKCSCKAEELYHPGTKTCNILAGHPCEPLKENCVLNAFCLNDTSLPHPQCVCNDGYSQVKDKTCKGNYDTECSIENSCNNELNLICRTNATNETNTCVCDTDYEFDGDKCLGLLGQNCTNNPDCVSEFCNEGTCKCPGQSTPLEGDKTKCYAPYGDPCPNGDDGPVVCNDKLFLSCMAENGTCGCESSEFIYLRNQDSQKCVVLAGNSCLDVNPLKKRVCHMNSECNENNICMCNAKFVADKDGVCLPGAGTFLQASATFTAILSMLVATFFK